MFNNPIMKEKISNKVCFGELGHPENRTETDMEKIAICLAEQPKKNSDGKLYGVFDILSTPNGRLLKSLCDYGCNIGISSRGQGDLITDDDGDEAVDPDTYDCECFDAVLVPGVEAARLQYVTENLNSKKTLKNTLKESLNSANEIDRKIMEETLRNLHINLIEEATKEPEQPKDDKEVLGSADKEGTSDEASEKEKDTATEPADVDVDALLAEIENSATGLNDDADNDTDDELADIDVDTTGLDDIDAESIDANEEPVRSDEEIFLDFLASNFDENKIKEVAKILDLEIVEDDVDETDVEPEQEAEETSDEYIDVDDEEVDKDAESSTEAVDERLDRIVSTLKEALKSKSNLETLVKSLQEKLAVSEAKANSSESTCAKLRKTVERLSSIVKLGKDSKVKDSELTEALSQKERTIESLNKQIDQLTHKSKDNSRLCEDLNKQKASYEAKIKTLTEQLAESKKNTANINTLNEKLNKQTKLKEGYKNLANKAVMKYIDVKADILGLSSKDITRKLGESYTIEDIDQVCEELKRYYFNVSTLPFNADRKVGIRVNEGNTPKITSTKKTGDDDDVDNLLMRMANFNR